MKDKGYRIVSSASGVERKKWSDYVKGHPTGNIFQSPEYYDLSCSLKGYSGVVVFCLDGERICGLVVAVINRVSSILPGALSSRSVIQGGPLTDNDDSEVARLLINEYNRQTKARVLFTQVRNLSDTGAFREVFISTGYRYEDHLNYLFDLTRGPEALWSSIHPTRRKQINRAYRRNVTVTVSDSADREKLEACYSILQSVYRKAALPMPPPEYFINADIHFGQKGMLRIFTANTGDEIIGFRMVLSFRGELFDWYAASSEDHLESYPNDVLPWEVIKWGCENNYTRFDFGGAGHPEKPYGVREYKKRYGGDEVNFGRFLYAHNRLAYFLMKTLFETFRSLVKRG